MNPDYESASANNATKPTVRFLPVPFGYGPIGTALHIAREIRKMVGLGVRLILVADSSLIIPDAISCFDEISDSLDERRCSLNITIMNQRAARLLSARNERFFIVDVLSWLWNKPYEVAMLADRYYYQDMNWLPTPAENLISIKNPKPVPPIISSLRSLADPTSRVEVNVSTPILSIGGLKAFPRSKAQSIQNQYLSLLLSKLLVNKDGSFVNNAPTVFGNADALGHFYHRIGISYNGNGRQDLMASCVVHSRQLICTAGLTTTLECLASGIRIGFLPPQNYSQARLMSILRGYGIPALSWNSSLCRKAETMRVSEAQGIIWINECIEDLSKKQAFITNDQLNELWNEVSKLDIPAELTEGRFDGATILANDILNAI